MLGVIMLSVVMLSVVTLNVIMLSVIMLSVVMLNVNYAKCHKCALYASAVMLNVVAPALNRFSGRMRILYFPAKRSLGN
jgi:hypothetical protein